MIDLNTINHAPVIEEILDVICNKTSNYASKGFFRVEIAYFLAKMAACMNAVIDTKDRGIIPVNLYALCLSESG